jgi:hypothetical protein
MKFFTPAEATATLPLVRRIVADILAAGQSMRQLAEQQGFIPDASTEFQALKNDILRCFDELEELGCSYRDWNFSVGLVDFPARFGDDEVLLCWKSDEPTLMYYHGADEGFAGRKPIPGNELGVRANSPRNLKSYE